MTDPEPLKPPVAIPVELVITIYQRGFKDGLEYAIRMWESQKKITAEELKELSANQEPPAGYI